MLERQRKNVFESDRDFFLGIWIFFRQRHNDDSDHSQNVADDAECIEDCELIGRCLDCVCNQTGDQQKTGGNRCADNLLIGKILCADIIRDKLQVPDNGSAVSQCRKKLCNENDSTKTNNFDCFVSDNRRQQRNAENRDSVAQKAGTHNQPAAFWKAFQNQRRKNGEKVCEQRQEADDAEIDNIDVVGG